MTSVARSFSDRSAIHFRNDVRTWLANAVPAEWALADDAVRTEDETIAVRRQWDRIVYEGGYVGLTWPVELGGRGLGPIEECIFYEEIAAANAPDMLNFIGFQLAAPAILEYGSEDQRERFVPRIVDGTDLWCEGFSEPDAGSDLAAARTFARPVSGGYRIEGQKIWTSFAHLADRCYLLARTGPTEARNHNLSLFLIEMHQPEIEVRGIRQITGASEFNEVFFNGAFVATDDRLGEENNGWHLATLSGFRQDMKIADAFRRYVIVRSVVDDASRCAAEMGRAVPGDLTIQADLLRWHVMRCAELRAQKGEVHGPSSILRIIWSELWQRAAEFGLSLGCPVHEAYWRQEFMYSRSVTISGGTSQIQRNVVADRVLKLPREARR